jgi:hypothetical protein
LDGPRIFGLTAREREQGENRERTGRKIEREDRERTGREQGENRERNRERTEREIEGDQ